MKITDTRIELTGLLFRARHGVEEREKAVGNSYRVTLSVRPRHAEAAMRSDCVDDTISYADLYEVTRHVVTGEQPSDLLEHVAGRLLEELGLRFPDLAEATVTITKLSPPIRGFIGDGASFTATATY